MELGHKRSPPCKPLPRSGVNVEPTTAAMHGGPEAVKGSNGPKGSTEGSGAAADLPMKSTDASHSVTPNSETHPPEYLVYWVFILIWLIYLFRAASEISGIAEPHLRRLKPPMALYDFLGARFYDDYDIQWRMFTSMLPRIVAGMGVFVVASRIARRGGTAEFRELFYAVAGVVFLAFLHGPQFIFPLFLILVNYFAIAGMHSRLPFWGYMVLMWSFHVAVLVGTRYYGGFTVGFFDDVEYAIWLRTGWARRIRWYILFNMSTLRMIAFNNDIREASFFGAERRERADARHNANCIECALLREAAKSAPLRRVSPSSSSCIASCESEEVPSGTRCYKYRTECPRPIEEYNLRAYLAYTLYIPLFIAGPILSFNAFASYCRHPSQGMSAADLRMYCVRICVLLFLLFGLLHFCFVNALRFHPSLFNEHPDIYHMAMLYYHLVFLWLKFNIIWKVFRFAALMDGVEPPENMNRCLMNTISIQDFWRNWHSSFNQWVVRYMYIPMGGNKTRLMNVFPIFLFIGIWHDLEYHLLQWAFGFGLFFAVEISVTMVAHHPRCSWLRRLRSYRFLRAFASTFSAVILCSGNAIGFSAQRQKGTKRSETATSLVDLFKHAFTWNAIGMGLFLFCCVSIGHASRQYEKSEQRRLRTRYHLKSPVPPNQNTLPEV